jgi:hypothetical protein
MKEEEEKQVRLQGRGCNMDFIVAWRAMPMHCPAGYESPSALVPPSPK